MSKIALSPNAAGTGTFTIAAPNSNNNRTLTLPDAAGELLTTTGDGSGLTNLPASGVGVGQTWQAVTRIANTSYQNTTGKPIEVAVYGNTTGLYFQVSVNNSTWVTVVGGYSNTATATSAVVPAGHYYRAHTSSSFISTWTELR
jgi:hypothetical protein